MDSQDRRAAVSRLAGILRRATRLVKIAPFVYALAFAVYMLLEPFLAETLDCAADSILAMSPFATGFIVAFSRLFGLCRWHLAACLLPLSGKVESLVDNFVIVFTQEEVMAINIMIGLASLVFIICANCHLYGRKAICKGAA